MSISVAAADPKVDSVGYGGGSGEFIMMMDAAPFIDSGRTFVPIRFVAETYGILTTWDNETKTAMLERGTTTVHLVAGSKTMIIIEKGVESSVEMDVAPMIKDGRTFLPVRFVAEAFGLEVKWMELYDEQYGIQTISHRFTKIIEGSKELSIRQGEKELLVYGGFFLKFFENDDFRFAYPLFPECDVLSKDNVISFYSPQLFGMNRIITATYIPVEGMPFADMDLESVISYIGDEYTTIVVSENTTVDGIAAVAYSFVPSDNEIIGSVCGVAFFHNDKLMRFEVGTDVENIEGFVSDEMSIWYSKSLLDELLPALTMK
jgi:hypothetical protein